MIRIMTIPIFVPYGRWVRMCFLVSWSICLAVCQLLVSSARCPSFLLTDGSFLHCLQWLL